MRIRLLILFSFCISTLLAQDADVANAGKLLLSESKKYVDLNTCQSLKSAVQMLSAYQVLADKYSLTSKEVELSKLSGAYASKCSAAGPAYSSIGSFVTKKVPNGKGGFSNYEIPSFIYSTYFMDEGTREQYLKTLDGVSLDLYHEWRLKNAELSLLLKSDTDEIKFKETRTSVTNALKEINWQEYQVPAGEVIELKADLLKSIGRQKDDQ